MTADVRCTSFASVIRTRFSELYCLPMWKALDSTTDWIISGSSKPSRWAEQAILPFIYRHQIRRPRMRCLGCKGKSAEALQPCQVSAQYRNEEKYTPGWPASIGNVAEVPVSP